MISILEILTGGGGGSKIPKIRLTSFVHGPLASVSFIMYVRSLENFSDCDTFLCIHFRPPVSLTTLARSLSSFSMWVFR